jgi:acetylornithine deacetylase/succinyl-diaminopimelate desuccinylase-like protein
MLACDLVISSDGGQWSETEPAILTGLRGGCGVQIDVHGPNRDLHSGLYGGAVQNPIHALTAILASMRGADGRILIEGFYDAVQPLTDDERRRFASLPFDEAAYMADLGVTALWGEAGYTTYERTWARPTLEINGIWGGFQGEGVKTVLPSEAHAKTDVPTGRQSGPGDDCGIDHGARAEAYAAGCHGDGNAAEVSGEAVPYAVRSSGQSGSTRHSGFHVWTRTLRGAQRR